MHAKRMSATPPTPFPNAPHIGIVGGGPAGLMAADRLLAAGLQVSLYDAMGSLGRKVLIAGRGGLNLTHNEPMNQFVTRYSEGQAQVASWLAQFDNQAMRDFVHGLGIETIVGSSDRVFPHDLKAAPFLRGWVRRLKAQGLQIALRHRLIDFSSEPKPTLTLLVDEQDQEQVAHEAIIVALGGGSWAKLGSDGRWAKWFIEKDIAVQALQPSNCGFLCDWSARMRATCAGQPVKPVTLSSAKQRLQGEFVITDYGVEGTTIYALSAALRRSINQSGEAILQIDLLPHLSDKQITSALAARGKRSLSEHLRRALHLSGARAQLLFELTTPEIRHDVQGLAQACKALPLRLHGMRDIDEAISTAGGVKFSTLNPQLMLVNYPGVFCAGEMLDWDAPTGGYLLTACMASGLRAATGVLDYLANIAQPVETEGL